MRFFEKPLRFFIFGRRFEFQPPRRRRASSIQRR